MKKAINYLMAIALIATVFIGCKKGENDPFLSLLSRTARITGVWNLSSADYQIVETEDAESTTTSYSFENGSMTETVDGYGKTYAYSQKVTIEKDGTFKIEVLEEIEWWNPGTFENEKGNDEYILEGVWYFLDGNNALDVKDKERVEFLIEKEKLIRPWGDTFETDYSGKANSYVQIFLLDKLANKEIVTLYDSEKTEGTYSEVQSGSSTYTGE
jgi:hypothetical protein